MRRAEAAVSGGTLTRTWDIFCSVVDNFGDIGVCWRLARQLTSERGQSVRLWVNDLASFHRLCRRVDPARELQVIDTVEVRHWGVPFPPVAPADIVIEGFGVRLPDGYVEAMAARSPHPVWINLEYLSAESWVDGCHGLPSPHPGLPLVKHFFFPGFTPATGGLLRESGLNEARDAFQSDPAAMTAFWRSLDLPPGGALRVSLFCYGNAALPAVVVAWSSDLLPVVCIVPGGKVLTQLS
ncbi:MAG: elongation factor P maturation arginine rhamnosyltransferase EarP, partial [Burkholderiales bacterium]|nr:elongation factor P maturation arginine rhamnosyltransferase EarP [Burkholderiales bacterium]